MPLEPNHIIQYLERLTNEKNKSELLNLLIKRIDYLCFETCQIDRVACTLTPSCNRRQFLTLRIINEIPEIPEFCYSVHKNLVLRDFRNKTVIYKPFDSYLYLTDFFDVFFHGDYHKLDRFFAKKQFDKIRKIFDNRILYQNEDFEYLITGNYIIFKFGDRIHVISMKKKYVLCNANRERIASLELLKGLCELYIKIHFPDVKLKLIPNQFVEITTIIPKDVISGIKSNYTPDEDASKSDQYFWNTFQKDLEALADFCQKITLNIDFNNNLEIKLYLNLMTNQHFTKKLRVPLRYRDMRLILNFIYRIYNDFYVIWL